MEMVSDLDRLVRLEEFLREEDPNERTKIILEWRDYAGDRLNDRDGEGDSSTEAPGKDRKEDSCVINMSADATVPVKPDW